MASKIILHIGLQKSGTTFLQQLLYDCGAALTDAGVLYPTPRDWARGLRSVPNHEWSSYGLLSTEYPWVSEQQAAAHHGSWKAVLDQVESWPGTALLSAEALSVIRSAAIDRLLTALGVDDVEVVITARSLDRCLPSLWQQHVRNGRSTSFDRYLGGLAEQREKGCDHIEVDPAAHIWRAFALSGLVRRWATAGAARVHVVTTPGRPVHVLWHRFVQAIGVPGIAEVPSGGELHSPAHAGLTAAETLVLASFNAALQEDGSWSRQDADRLRTIITQAFQARAERGTRLALPPKWRPRVAEWSAKDLAELPGAGARLVGDIDDLRVDADGGKAAAPAFEEAGTAGAAALLALADSGLRPSAIRRVARRIRG